MNGALRVLRRAPSRLQPIDVDVLGMDDTHIWPVPRSWLECRDFTVTSRALYGKPDDSLLAWWTP